MTSPSLVEPTSRVQTAGLDRTERPNASTTPLDRRLELAQALFLVTALLAVAGAFGYLSPAWWTLVVLCAASARRADRLERDLLRPVPLP